MANGHGESPYQPLDRAWPSCRVFWVCFSVDRMLSCHPYLEFIPHVDPPVNRYQQPCQAASSLIIGYAKHLISFVFTISEDARCHRKSEEIDASINESIQSLEQKTRGLGNFGWGAAACATIIHFHVASHRAISLAASSRCRHPQEDACLLHPHRE